jgi:hypothetical protein
VSELLDLRKFPRKPQYQMAPELPLLLHTCGFEDLEFRSTPGENAAMGAAGGCPLPILVRLVEEQIELGPLHLRVVIPAS